MQKNLHQTFVVSGDVGWHVDGAGGVPVPLPPGDVSIGQLEIWMNPHGFLKAARLPGANPKAVWRWELGEMGRDGPTTVPDKVHVVSISFGKYRIDATINKQNQIQRIHTMVPEPALGDFNYEHESTDQRTFGAVTFPIAWHSHQGWDDNFGFENVTAGHNAFGGTFPNVEPNNCGPAVTVPDAVRRAATAPPAVTVDTLADGVYLLGGGPANSIAVEFKTFVAVFEAPTSEARSLAVIEQIAKLMPDKPIRYLVNSHQHFDHIGGIRAYLHIGATIVTQRKNITFLNRDVLNYRPRTLLPDMVSLWPPTEVAEGYNYESFNENYVITDGARLLQVFYVQPLQHAEGMAMAYLPAEKIVMQANLFDTHEPPPARPTQAMTTFYRTDAHAQPGRLHHRARPWTAGADGRVHQGHGHRRQRLPCRGSRRLGGVEALPLGNHAEGHERPPFDAAGHARDLDHIVTGAERRQSRLRGQPARSIQFIHDRRRHGDPQCLAGAIEQACTGIRGRRRRRHHDAQRFAATEPEIGGRRLPVARGRSAPEEQRAAPSGASGTTSPHRFVRGR